MRALLLLLLTAQLPPGFTASSSLELLPDALLAYHVHERMLHHQVAQMLHSKVSFQSFLVCCRMATQMLHGMHSRRWAISVLNPVSCLRAESMLLCVLLVSGGVSLVLCCLIF
jgi:hypothetical protein